MRTFFTLPSRLMVKKTAQCRMVELRTLESIERRSQLGSILRFAAAMYQP
jgi:hypothetical protein